MTGLFIIAHAPLASALRSAAMHAYAELAPLIGIYDVPPGDNRVAYAEEAKLVMDSLQAEQILILTDMPGATPAIVAQSLAVPGQRRVLAGVNVPMLWRALNYCQLPLDALFEKAIEGGVRGVQQMDTPAPQEQAKRPLSDDPNQHHHHQ